MRPRHSFPHEGALAAVGARERGRVWTTSRGAWALRLSRARAPDGRAAHAALVAGRVVLQTSARVAHLGIATVARRVSGTLDGVLASDRLAAQAHLGAHAGIRACLHLFLPRSTAWHGQTGRHCLRTPDGLAAEGLGVAPGIVLRARSRALDALVAPIAAGKRRAVATASTRTGFGLLGDDLSGLRGTRRGFAFRGFVLDDATTGDEGEHDRGEDSGAKVHGGSHRQGRGQHEAARISSFSSRFALCHMCHRGNPGRRSMGLPNFSRRTQLRAPRSLRACAWAKWR